MNPANLTKEELLIEFEKLKVSYSSLKELYDVDITARKKEEIVLKKSEANLEEAQRIAHVGSWEWDMISNTVSWSKEMFQVYDIDPDTYDGRPDTLLNVIHPDDKGIFIASMKNNLECGNSPNLEYRVVYRDGSVHFILARGRIEFNEYGKPIRNIGTVQDITEQKHVEEALRENEEKYRLLHENAGIGIGYYKPDGTVISYNRLAASHMGGDPGDFAGRSIYDIFKKDEAEFYQKRIESAVLSDIPVVYEDMVPLPGGNKYFISTFSKIVNIHNNISGIQIISQDITKMKLAEEALLEAREKAEESDRLKTAFLANMSHEIRTPMNGILGFAGLLKEPGLATETQKEFIEIIEKSGERMLNIINDIIDISKIESGQMDVSYSETNIDEKVEDICSFFKQEARQKGLQVITKTRILKKDVIIKTDKEKLYAILTNLVKNSIKFTDKGFIEIGYKIVVETHNNVSLLQFYVKDTGIGIPRDRMEAIFDRFIQADISDTRAFQGAGLGLSIAKAYVEMLGGKIWVESEELTGSTFYFTIPFIPGIADIDFLQVIQTGQKNIIINNLKVLIVEDDHASEMLISLAIKQVSREILKVRTGSEAIEVCRKNPDIDVVLMDIKLPGIDGYEATRQIREFNKGVKIIAQTAFALIGDRERAIEAGCNDYLSKPTKKEVLLEMIGKQFSMSN